MRIGKVGTITERRFPPPWTGEDLDRLKVCGTLTKVRR